MVLAKLGLAKGPAEHADAMVRPGQLEHRVCLWKEDREKWDESRLWQASERDFSFHQE